MLNIFKLKSKSDKVISHDKEIKLDFPHYNKESNINENLLKKLSGDPTGDNRHYPSATKE
jgi:hypothetical protein